MNAGIWMVAVLMGAMAVEGAAAENNLSLTPLAARTLGICAPMPNHDYSSDNWLNPIYAAGYYLEAYESRNSLASATTAIVKQPKHGVLRLVTEADRGTRLARTTAAPLDPNALYAFLPDSDYEGNDSATFQVDFGNGLKVKVKYYFKIVDRSGGDGTEEWGGEYCRKTGFLWKISSTFTFDANGTRVKEATTKGFRLES